MKYLFTYGVKVNVILSFTLIHIATDYYVNFRKQNFYAKNKSFYLK